MRERISIWLSHPRGHVLTIGIALLLAIPCIGDRLVLDDHVLAVQARPDPGIAGFQSRPLDLFTFTDGDPANNHRLMDEGALLPWWSHPQLRVAFFRPLSSLTHVFDFAVLHDHVRWMGVHTLLWWAALLFVLAHIYHRFYGYTAFAGFALLLYAIDDVHGATLSWLSNRNAVIATMFALPALGALHRARTQNWNAGYWIGPLCFALGMCAGETALGLCGYLFAYAVLVDRGPLRARIAMLMPYVLIVVVWRVAYQAMGYGAFGSDGYHDPGREPIAFLRAATIHLPILLAAQFGAGVPPLADLLSWGPPEWTPMIVGTAVFTLLVCGAVIWPVLRDNALNRFWLLGALIAVLPSAASVPGERLLMFVGVGAAPVIGASIRYWWQRFSDTRSWLVGTLLAGMLATHLLAAPIGLVMRGGSLETLGRIIDQDDASLGFDASLPDEHVVIVNPPFDVMVSYLQVARQSREQIRPRHLHWLSTASSKLTVTRTSDRTLRIAPEHGFVKTVTERHYNSEPEQLTVGHKIALTGMDAVIVKQTDDERPAVVDFTFDRPLDARGLRLMQWNGSTLSPFVAPEVGQQVELPADGLLSTLLRNAVGTP